jgi:hypothetical protein
MTGLRGAALFLSLALILAACGEAGTENPPPPQETGGGPEIPAGPYTADSLEALRSLLAALPQNTPDGPYRIEVSAVSLSERDGGEGLKALYASLQGRYAVLDLDACTGATVCYTEDALQNFAPWPGRDRLAGVILPPQALRIGYYAFINCVSLETVVVPPGLKTIGHYAFKGCASLRRIDLPSSLTVIDFGAFEGCSRLESLTVRAVTPPAPGSNSAPWFTGTAPDLTIYVPPESVEAYQNAPAWASHAAKIRAISAEHEG